MNRSRVRHIRIPVGELETNTYLLHAPGSADCLLVDPGAEPERIRDSLEQQKLIPVLILLTHCHIDHTGAASELARRYSVPVSAHEQAAPLLKNPFNAEMAAAFGLDLPPAADRLLRDDEVLSVAGLSWRVWHTPGHSPGSICLLCADLLVSGDTLFAGSVGRTDLPGGDFALLQASLDRLKTLPPHTRILPGHGEESILERELRHNPFM
ncbi:MAG TPA: MBL fold metallo-hydrolase [Candidatus Aminicenantes bacterium]|nr:MBL fold metallo-hydrolase [Candidatus Aminicenantes bacterium]